MSDLHVVLGGTGGAGADTVKELVARGKRVRATSRTVPSQHDTVVEWMAVDALNAGDIDRACQGASVIYHCVNVPYASWSTQLVPIAKATKNASPCVSTSCP